MNRRPAWVFTLPSLRRFAASSLLGASVAVAVACSPGDGDGDAGPELSEWLGEDEHFAISGRLNGEDLDVRLEGEAASDSVKLYCEREYAVNVVGGERDWSTGRVMEVKIIAHMNVGGEEREATIELKRNDLSQHEPGTKLSVIPRDDANDPGPKQLWIEWEWAVDGTETYEQAAQSGTLTVEEFSGTPDDTGVIVPEGEGRLGVYLEAEWSETERLKLSATVPCTKNAIEELTQ